MSERRPNILFVMTDQMRHDAIARPEGATSHLSSLAKRGLTFSHCFTNSPACVPARVSLALGGYPHNTGVWQNMPHTVEASASLWTNHIKAAGYQTSVFGKTHLHPQRGDLRDRAHLLHAMGFDVVDEVGGPRACMIVGSNLTALWERHGLKDAYREDILRRISPAGLGDTTPSILPLELYPDSYVGEQARRHLEGLSADRPWFCWVSFPGPHEPWDTPEPFASLFDPAEMPGPHPKLDEPFERPLGYIDQHPMRHHSLGQGDLLRMRASYSGNVALIDAQIGRILQTIEARGESDRTVIVFTSDHGEMNGDHGLLYKSNFLDPAIRIPLIVRAPGVIPNAVEGATSDALIELHDLGPLLCELAGVQAPPLAQARSFLAALRDPKIPHRSSVLCEFKKEIMYLDRRWKMALNQDGEAYLLFDLDESGFERINRAGDPNLLETRKALFQRLLKTLMDRQAYIPDPREKA